MDTRAETWNPEAASLPGDANMIEARNLVNGDRQADYGSPAVAWDAVAKTWSGLLAHVLKRDLTAAECAILMTALKLNREMNRPKRDNRVDAHGYLVVLDHCREAEGADGA